MRKILMTLLIAVFLLGLASLPAAAQTKGVQINFEWDQSNITTNFWGWRMWVGTSPGGPYDYLGKDANDQPIPLFSVQYDPANPTGPFTGTGDITAPDNAETTFYFVVNAWDNAGNHSSDSNEVSYTADFLGPDAPTLSITGTIIISTP
jgi:hypothetical protein